MAGLYIHIPFCRQKCSYCDFFSIVSDTYADKYIDALINESILRKIELNDEPINTIYIGGGTPSLLTSSQLKRLIEGINGNISFENVVEFTIEANPDDVTEDFANAISMLHINRVSMGVQSFIDSELQAVNRRHKALQVFKAYEILRNNNVNNISLDLIFGLPGQTLSSLKESLDKMIELRPEHISVYGLMYEKGTLLYKLRETGKIKECSDETYSQMEDLVEKILSENGYIHYEISNYALDGKHSLHNSSYWNDTPYLGLGVSAHSYDGKIRRYNSNNLIKYINTLEKKKTFYESEEESLFERYDSYVMTRLRTIWGISLTELKAKFGEQLYLHFIHQIGQFLDSKEMRIENNVVVITKKGIIRSDTIFRELFYVH